MSDEEKQKEDARVSPVVTDQQRVTSPVSGEDDFESADEDEAKPASTEPSKEPISEDKPSPNEDIEENEKIVADDAASTSSAEAEERRRGRRRIRDEENGEEENENAASAGEPVSEFLAPDEQEEGEDEEEQGEEVDEGADDEQEVSSVTNKATDDREDVRDPAYVPRRGNFFQHDTRAAAEEPDKNDARQSKKQMMIEKMGRWQHDMFDEREQTPKSRNELVNNYGYDIRNESRAPRDPRGRRYGRSQNFERDWRDPDSYSRRRPYGGYRRNFGGGPGGRGSGRGRQQQQQEQQQQYVKRGRSASPGQEEDGQYEYERVDEANRRPYRAGRAGRSRSFSEAEREYEKGAPYSNRGRYNGSNRNQRGSYGTVEFRRRGRGMAFSSDHRGRGGRGYDNGGNRGSMERDGRFGDSGWDRRQFGTKTPQQRELYAYQTPPRFQQQQATRGRGSNSEGFNQNRREVDRQSNESTDVSYDRQHQSAQEHSSKAMQQRPRNQDHANIGASSKRYSAIRQQTHPQATIAPSTSATSTLSSPVHQGAPTSGVPLMMQQAPPPQPGNAAPISMITSSAPFATAVPYPPYYNGTAVYQSPQGVPVTVTEVYPMPPPAFTDGSNAYVLPHAPMAAPPPRYIGHQQYPPAVYQPMPHYQAEATEAYVAAAGGHSGGTGGTVYFDTGSQQLRTQQQYTPTDGGKRRDKSIPIVSPEQITSTSENVETETHTDQQ